MLIAVKLSHFSMLEKCISVVLRVRRHCVLDKYLLHVIAIKEARLIELEGYE